MSNNEILYADTESVRLSNGGVGDKYYSMNYIPFDKRIPEMALFKYIREKISKNDNVESISYNSPADLSPSYELSKYYEINNDEYWFANSGKLLNRHKIVYPNDISAKDAILAEDSRHNFNDEFDTMDDAALAFLLNGLSFI